MTTIRRVNTGFQRVYLIEGGSGLVLIDSGRLGLIKTLKATLGGLGRPPSDVGLIVLTHVHVDHVGGLAAAKELTGAKVLVHAAEKDILERGLSTMPAGTGIISRPLVRALRPVLARGQGFRPVSPDIVIDREFDLGPFGVAGKAVPTPGHTAGSISVFLDAGQAFVGDTCFNHRPRSHRSVFPPFADDVPTLLKTWEALLASGASEFYPGHGRPFGRAKLKASLARMVKSSRFEREVS
jgi:hydroxyacylglutathione hydrolase